MSSLARPPPLKRDIPALIRCIDAAAGCASEQRMLAVYDLGQLAWQSDAARQAIAAAGAIPTLTRVLCDALTFTFPPDNHDVLLQVAGMALIYLCFGSPANKADIVEDGAVPLLVQALAGSSSYGSEMVQACAEALHNLCSSKHEPDTQAAVAAGGAIPAFVRLLQHSSNAEVLDSAAARLSRLASGTLELQQAVAAAGAIPAAVRLLHTCSAEPVLYATASCLGHLAMAQELWPAIVTAGGVGALVSALRRGTDTALGCSERLQASVAQALHLLSHCPDSGLHLLQAGAAAAVVPLLLRSSTKVQRDAAVILANHACHGGSEGQRTVAAAAPTLLGLLRKQPHPHGVDAMFAEAQAAAAATLKNATCCSGEDSG